MNLIIDEAIILNIKESSATNVIVTMFTKNYGKISSLGYNFRNSKKKELSSIIPMSISEVELEEKNDSYILKNSILKHNFTKNIKNIFKMQIQIYMIQTLNEVLMYNYKDEMLYEKIIDIFHYIHSLDDDKFKDNKFLYHLLITYLRRLMIELGIFDIDEITNKYFFKDLYSKYLKNNKNLEKIEKKDLKIILNAFEEYVNSYFMVNIDYKKILILENKENDYE